MPCVRVLPSDVVFAADDAETVLAAAVRHGYRWPSVCGGIAECTTCLVEVRSGEEHLSPRRPGEAEALRLRRGEDGAPPAHVRLACQARVSGDVVVEKRGVRPPRPPGGD